MTMYCSLPNTLYSEASSLGIKSTKSVKNDFVESFLKRHVPENRIKKGELDDLKVKAQVIDNNIKKKFGNIGKVRKKKYLTAKEKRELKIFDISKEHQSINEKNVHTASGKLLKADYHGCYLTVQKSKCPSYIGVSGIVLQETRNMFKLITKENKIKCIPKQNSIFVFEIDGYCFTIHGNNFKVKSSERAVKKFKQKPTIDL